jgi:Domain of unknown function (DUF1874)
MIAILNATILTSFGEYSYTALELEETKKLLKEGFTSYAGHEAANRVIGKLFEIDLQYSREMYFQQPGEKAIVFKLNKRLGAGEVLNTVEEIEAVGYTIGLLTRNK